MRVYIYYTQWLLRSRLTDHKERFVIIKDIITFIKYNYLIKIKYSNIIKLNKQKYRFNTKNDDINAHTATALRYIPIPVFFFFHDLVQDNRLILELNLM